MPSTVFQSPEWIDAYQSAFATQPVCVTTGSGDAAAAFEPVTRLRARVLRSFAQEVSDYTDVQELQSVAAADELAQALVTSGTDVVEFGQVPPDGLVHGLIQRWPGQVVSLPTSSCVLFEGSSLADYLFRLSGSRRRTFGKLHRRLLAGGVSWQVCDDPASGALQMLAWHRAWWRGRGLNPLHETEQFAAFLTRIAASRLARLVEFQRDSTPIGYALYLRDRGRAANFLVGYDREASGSLSHTVLELVAGFELLDENSTGVDFLRGAYVEKLRFATSTPLNRRYLLLRPGSGRAQAYAMAVGTRAAVQSRRRDTE